jgi:hypothetical protein
MVTVLLGNGDATFKAAPSSKTKYPPAALAVADLDGDQKPDLVIGPSLSKNNGAVLLGVGDGTFGRRIDFTVGNGAGPLWLVDVNGDGHLDLLTPDVQTGSVSLLAGDGKGGFGARTDFGAGPEPVSVAVTDADGDGKLDLVVANREASALTVLPGVSSSAKASRE